jgi:hypothetical protein
MALLTMTIFSTALAAATSVMAWRVRRREARRSEARIAALASGIHGPDAAAGLETATAIAAFPSEHSMDLVPDGPAALSLSRNRLLASLSAAAVVVAGLLILAATKPRGEQALPGRGGAVAELNSATRPPAQSAAQAAPLELIALSHERGKDTLVVSGAVRNPSNGTTCEMPAVVVLTFDEHGIFLGSSESDAGGESLPPGARATFSVSVPAGATMAARYKVSFRNAGRIVPHVDKRVPVAAGAARIPGAPTGPKERPVRS